MADLIYRSATSGLWYQNPKAAGDIDAIRLGEAVYTRPDTAKPGIAAHFGEGPCDDPNCCKPDTGECEWGLFKEEFGESYITGCHDRFRFKEGGHCPGCGKPIKVREGDE